MSSDLPDASPAHRAALLLHALSAPDRQWVLQGLGSAQQETLHGLLRDLEELGIPRDAELAGLVTGPTRDAAEVAPELQALDAACVRGLARRLALEPPRVAALLLASRGWNWRETLLQELPAAFAAEVGRPSLTVPPATRLQAAVLAAVVELAPGLHADMPAPARASLWQLARRRLPVWREQR